MKKNYNIFLAIFLLCCFHTASSQECVQPGSLVTVFHPISDSSEYIVFKFLKPYHSKGTLTPYNGDLFAPLTKGKTFYRITFTNVVNYCYDKLNRIKPGNKMTGFKTETKNGGTVSYVFELAEGIKIANHFAYNYHNSWFVKIKIQ